MVRGLGAINCHKHMLATLEVRHAMGGCKYCNGCRVCLHAACTRAYKPQLRQALLDQQETLQPQMQPLAGMPQALSNLLSVVGVFNVTACMLQSPVLGRYVLCIGSADRWRAGVSTVHGNVHTFTSASLTEPIPTRALRELHAGMHGIQIVTV